MIDIVDLNPYCFIETKVHGLNFFDSKIQINQQYHVFPKNSKLVFLSRRDLTQKDLAFDSRYKNLVMIAHHFGLDSKEEFRKSKKISGYELFELKTSKKVWMSFYSLKRNHHLLRFYEK